MMRLNGPISYIAGPVYNGLVAMELAMLRALDGPRNRVADADLAGKITAVVKTFERPGILRRLVNSLRRLYPKLPLIIVDDSRKPVQFDGVETIVLPYDSGVSAGKNAGLAQVKTPYVWMLDDDFVVYRHTRLKHALEALEQHPEIDIMGGKVVYLPLFRTVDYSKAALFPTSAESTFPAGTLIGGYEVYDKVANFYVARTDRLRLVGWDPALKRIDHADFFTRAKGVLTTVYDPSFKVLHAKNRFDKIYMRHRSNHAADRIVLAYKYRRKIITRLTPDRDIARATKR